MVYTEVAEARGQRHSMLFKDSTDLISIMRYNLLNINILPPPPLSPQVTLVLFGALAHITNKNAPHRKVWGSRKCLMLSGAECFCCTPTTAVFISCKRLFPYGTSSFHPVQPIVSLWNQQFSSRANDCFPMELAVFIPCKRLFPYGTNAFHPVQTFVAHATYT